MRIALGIEYNGQQYFGWQKQHHVISVQACVERALEQISLHPVAVVCAGRTDAGVHATQQVVHFDTSVDRPDGAWTMGVNSHLPDDIAIRWVKRVGDDFSARFTAESRRYRYVIYNAPFRAAILNGGVTHIHQPLNAERMHAAGQVLLGENDFSSFRAAQCQSHSPFRKVHFITVKRFGAYVVIDIQANAFVHHMVRNIAGALIVVGSGEQPKQWLEEVLAAKDRRVCSATAKPNGLYLVHVQYPPELEMPKVPLGPLFLPER
ncbi:tRNA pseudouridine(38-40) synthase TruA [Aliidiomarina quisquiliarum]|uniref:tRNA pseudouridine(38-40) synthase TruA n=1 Tax=Aliidiomarina quisquiliarum TaxID=2938947 RepID=UPI00208DEAC3|nr:tRNA pseudouridine(38-40) synthase TruA [Aliidiomarina quisquiliarum]MCO4322036.1 tRNA pseudouridine(38-40) synthase TruA [Aliidiomarina quisquiliarum]